MINKLLFSFLIFNFSLPASEDDGICRGLEGSFTDLTLNFDQTKAAIRQKIEQIYGSATLDKAHDIGDLLSLVLKEPVQGLTGIEPISVEEIHAQLLLEVNQRLEGSAGADIASVFDEKMAQFVSTLVRRFLSNKKKEVSLQVIYEYLSHAVKNSAQYKALEHTENAKQKRKSIAAAFSAFVSKY